MLNGLVLACLLLRPLAFTFFGSLVTVSFYEWWYGIIGFSILWPILFVALTTHTTFIAITLYLHRHSAHRALDLHPALCHFFRFFLWISTGMVTREWTAVHRRHHAKTETEEDPHSPVIFGLFNIIRKGSEYYRDGIDEETIRKYGKGTPDDWVERNIYSRFTWAGVALFAVIDILLFGITGVIVWAVQMIWTPFWAAGIVNGVGHAWGYRNFETQDASKNIVPVGILVCGEELHNNHHTYPNSARFSFKPWEFDLGWQYIRALRFLRLARPLHTGPVVEQVSGKSIIDMDTLWAVVNDRFSVMARYAEDVVKPIVRSEKQDANGPIRRLLRGARRILCSHELVLRDREINKIDEIIRHSPQLKVIYDLHEELNSLWAKRTGSGEELLSAFKRWCARAEATGVEVLRSFVADLKTYSVPKTVDSTSS